YTSDSLQIRTFFQQNGAQVFHKDQFLKEALTDHYRLTASSGVDSLSLTYGLENGDYIDGEERSIPLYPTGSLETEGQFQVLWRDTALNLSFAKDLPVTIMAAGHQLELLLEEVAYLKDYPHDCMEQTASRLMAFCFEKQIRKSLHEKFTDENEIRKLVKKLEDAQGQ